MSLLRKAKRVGKRACKFQYTATYQSVVVECTTKEKWRPKEVCVSWTRRGRRFITALRPWQPSPDNKARGVVIWPDQEVMEITVTLYKGPKDKSYEPKEWEFAVIDVDETGNRKKLATASINMVRYVSSLPYEHDLHLRLKPVSKKIKSVILEVSLTSEFLKEGKATDDDMMSIASMMSVSNLSTIGFLEDDEDDDYSYMTGGRSISPPQIPDHILSTDELLKWAQEITEDMPGVKITNMTTSWRSGLGFLAIIHYYRPDLMPDFDLQSPNSIKENNRTAFNLARSLGIACPLTPNMMVTTTIPDKLSVMSFLYQMYQYFTQAKQSAISRAKQQEGEQKDRKSSKDSTSETSPSSPFDISKFGMFAANNISPVTTPPPSTDRVMQYSRHSKENLRRQSAPEIHSPVDLENPFGIGQDENLRQSTPNTKTELSASPRTAAKLRLDRIITEQAEGVPGQDDSTHKSAVVSNFERDREVEFENADTESSAMESSTSLLSEEKSELPSEIKPVNSSADVSVSSESPSIYKYTPGQITKKSSQAEKTSAGRKLPSVPSYTSSPKIKSKREEIRKQAQEMLKKHKLDKAKFSHQNIDNLDPQSTSVYRRKAIEMLSEAFSSPTSSLTNLSCEDLVSEGSATSLGRTSTDDELSSRSADVLPTRKLSHQAMSDSSLSVTRKTGPVSATPKGTGSSRGEGRGTGEVPPGAKAKDSTAPASESRTSRPKKDSDVGQKGEEVVKGKTSGDSEKQRNSMPDLERKIDSAELPVKKAVSPSKRSSESNLTKKQPSDASNKEGKSGGKAVGGGVPSGDSVAGNRKRLLTESKRPSDSSLLTSADAPVSRVRSSTTGHISRVSNRPSSAVGGERQRKKLTKPAPVARPISAQPSQAVLRRMAEQKRIAEEKEREERLEREREEQERMEREEQERLEREKREAEALKEEESCTDGDGVTTEGQTERANLEGLDLNTSSAGTSSTKGTPSANGTTPQHKKSLPSPSAWSQHSEDISQDLLVTQSEYVKTELLSLQAQTQDLENRAKDIEMNIRTAMSEGNKESEEDLMQEWFGLLNRKNELIKRQIELNIIEKEEDLEKRQFFLNRELRPLMEISEEEKTTEQKAREEHLLRELFELIDERDKLERKKMTNMKNTYNERAGFAVAQAKSADIVNKPHSHGPMTRQGSGKDCVIS